MSLFDDDDSSSSSSASDVAENIGCHAVIGRQNVSSASFGSCASGGAPGSSVALVGGDVSRFTLTLDENRRAEERRRKEAHSRSLLCGASTADAKNGGSGEEESRFHTSIAEALQLRRDAREALLLRRIQRQRQEEAGCSELVNKDLEVGVFVTPQYLAALRRHRGPAKGSSESLAPNDATDGADGADPLEAYVRQLEEKRQAITLQSSFAAPSTDVRTADGSNCDDVKMTVERQAVQQSLSVNNSSGASLAVTLEASGEVSVPSLNAVRTAAAAAPHDTRSGERNDDHVSLCISQQVSSSQNVSPEDVLRVSRENRKRSRVDNHFIGMAAERFNRRAMERLWVR